MADFVSIPETFAELHQHPHLFQSCFHLTRSLERLTSLSSSARKTSEKRTLFSVSGQSSCPVCECWSSIHLIAMRRQPSSWGKVQGGVHISQSHTATHKNTVSGLALFSYFNDSRSTHGVNETKHMNNFLNRNSHLRAQMVKLKDKFVSRLPI